MMVVVVERNTKMNCDKHFQLETDHLILFEV